MNFTALGCISSCVAILNFLFATPSIAHEGRGINGGQLADRGAVHIEFIGGQGYSLMIFAITDKSQKPLPVDKRIAFAAVELNGQDNQIPLSSDGGNFLSSSEGAALKAGEEVRFIARMSNGETLKVEFISR